MKQILFFLLVFFLFQSCKEDFEYTGSLKVEFEEDRATAMNIWDMENMSKVLFRISAPGKTKSVRMNPGNYYITLIGMENYNSGDVFQIQTGHTTKILFKDSGEVIIDY